MPKFKRGTPGEPCCDCEGEVTVYINGCNDLGVSGVDLDILQSGSPVASGTTNSSGFVAFTLPPGNYHAQPAATDGFDPASATPFTVGEDCEPVSVSIDLTPDSDNYVCCPTRARPIPKDLDYTDTNGTRASTFVDLGTIKRWSVCYTVTKTNCYTYDGFGNCTGPTTHDVAVGVTLSCGPSGMTCQQTFFIVGCVSGFFTYCYYDAVSTCVDDTPAGTSPITVNATSVTNNLPTSYTGTWPTNSGSACANGNVLTLVPGSFTFAPP